MPDKRSIFVLGRFFLVSFLALFASGCPAPVPLEPFVAPPPSASADNWTTPLGKSLAWSEEFSGSGIDLSTWSYETEATGWSPTWNGEWQRYTNNGTGGPNASINDGVLVIRALKTSGGDGGFTSARLVTKGKADWQYGVIVARMQLPYGQGIWPAFWLMGNSGSWPANGEIDVMEMIGGAAGGDDDRRTYGTIHWQNTVPAHASYGDNYLNAAPLSADWHYYELEWSNTTITIRFDHIQVMTRSIVGAEYDEFRQPFYALLNLAVGGAWPGPPDATTVFPQYMYIDWVRVYQ